MDNDDQWNHTNNSGSKAALTDLALIEHKTANERDKQSAKHSERTVRQIQPHRSRIDQSLQQDKSTDGTRLDQV